MADELDSAAKNGAVNDGGVMRSAFCGELRSKKFFMLDVLPTEASEYLDDSGHCWCFHTQQVVGPDGMMAGPEHCGPGRGCYRSGLAGEV